MRTTLSAAIAALVALILGPGCAASPAYSSSSYAGGGSYGALAMPQSGYDSVEEETVLAAEASGGSGDDVWRGGGIELDAARVPSGDVTSAPQSAPPPMVAQAAPPRREMPPAAQTPAERPGRSEQPQSAATDAVDTSGPLLIYTALLHLAVYEVAESQERIVAAARELGGFVFTQADDRLVLRVPAPRFYALLERIEAAGDVEHRQVQAQDVSEEFQDIAIRIRNLEAMRARVEALLAQAQTVEDALQVQQELNRITDELERMRGRQRFLADRIAFSTITVMFRPRPREMLGQPDVFELPFGWLDQLGLSTLLNLR